MLAFCTSAIREAGNGRAVLDRVKAEANVTLQELTGPEEAGMTLVAVRRWYGWGRAPCWTWTSAAVPLKWRWGTTNSPTWRYPCRWEPGD